MANREHLHILKKGIDKWNLWREENTTVIPDLSEADLSSMNLKGINLIGVDLHKASLEKTDLTGAVLGGANLLEASLREAILTKTELTEAIFRGANLCRAHINNAVAFKTDFSDTNLQESNLSSSEFNESKFDNADMQGADLRKSDFCYAFFNKSKLRGANLRKAKIRGADVSEVDFSHADLTESDLCRATLTKARLEHADISGCILYGTSRDEWKIINIKCSFVFWDEKGQIRDPKDREFDKGEFEKLYEEFPKFEYIFINGFTPIDAFLIDQVVQEINSQNPDFELKLDSFHSRGLARAVFTIRNKTYAEDALEKIRLSYEKKIVALETERETLEKCFMLAIKEPRYMIKRLGLGDIIESKEQHGDITIVKDQARIGTLKYINPAAEDLVLQIKNAIQQSDASDIDKSRARQQLQKIEEELSKKSPEKSHLKKYCEYIGKYLPNIAKNIPWKKLIEKIFLDIT